MSSLRSQGARVATDDVVTRVRAARQRGARAHGIVLLVTDANFRRYGISPRALGNIARDALEVRSCARFIDENSRRILSC